MAGESDWEPWGFGFDPWPFSVGWGSGVAVSHGVGHRCGSDLVLLRLWCRPVATAPIWPLAWELPYAEGVALKRQRKKEKNIIKRKWFFSNGSVITISHSLLAQGLHNHFESVRIFFSVDGLGNLIPSSFYFLMIFIFSIIVGLQCSVSFLQYSKVTQSYIHIYILFLTLSSIMLHHK